MNVSDLISLLTNRVGWLQRQLIDAESQGDVERVDKLTNDVTETQATLTKLRTLPE